MKKEQIVLRTASIIFSLAVHIFMCWFFLTVRFSVYDEERKPAAVLIRPVLEERLFLPAKGGKRLHHMAPGGSKPMPGTPRGDKKTEGEKNGAEKTAAPTVGNSNGNRSAASGEAETLPPAEPLIAPQNVPAFDAKQYLKSESLEDIFRAQNKKIVGGRGRYGLPMNAGEGADAGGDDIVVDPSGREYFRGRGFDIGPWARELAAQINRNWMIYSIIPVAGKAEVGVSIRVSRNGQLKTAEIRTSSAIQALDQSAMNAISLTRPLPSLPDAFAADQLDAYLLFNYSFPGDDSEIVEFKKVNSSPMMETDDMILKLGLVQHAFTERTDPPSEIFLGLICGLNADYRLRFGEQTISAGALRKGFNQIAIPAQWVIEKSGLHEFSLEMKTPTQIIRRFIQCVVARNEPDNSGQVSGKIRETGFGLAVFIENQLIAYHKKSVRRQEISVIEQNRKEFELERMGRRPPDPHNINGEKYQKASVPVLLLPILAYKHLVKPAIDKKPELAPKLSPQIRKTFIASRENGKNTPIEIHITIRLLKNLPANRS